MSRTVPVRPWSSERQLLVAADVREERGDRPKRAQSDRCPVFLGPVKHAICGHSRSKIATREAMLRSLLLYDAALPDLLAVHTACGLATRACDGCIGTPDHSSGTALESCPLGGDDFAVIDQVCRQPACYDWPTQFDVGGSGSTCRQFRVVQAEPGLGGSFVPKFSFGIWIAVHVLRLEF